MMTSAGFPHANQTAVKQLTLLLINISTLHLCIVQLAENVPLFSAHSGFFSPGLWEKQSCRRCFAARWCFTGGSVSGQRLCGGFSGLRRFSPAL